MFFGGSKKEVFALLDINSQSVAGAFVVISKKHAPYICYTTRIPLHVSYESDRGALLRALEKGVQELTTKLDTEGRAALSRACGARHISDVLVSVGSPWQKTAIRSQVQTFTKPQRITSADLDAAREKTASQLEVDEQHTKIIDHAIIDVLINGYQSSKPIGKRAQRLGVVTLASMIPVEVHDLLIENLERIFNAGPIRMQTTPALSYVVLRDTFAHERDFLVSLISGEATDILLVKQGILTSVHTLLSGVHTLARSIAQTQPMRVVEEKLATDDIEAFLTDEFAGKAKQAKQSAQNTWISEVHLTISEISRRHALPQTFFVLSDEKCRAEFASLLRSEDVHALRMGEQGFTVLPIKTEHLTDYVVFTGHAQKDMFLAILALFANQHISVEK